MYSDRKQMRDCLEMGDREGWEGGITKGYTDTFGVMNRLIILIVMMYIYTYVKTLSKVSKMCFNYSSRSNFLK